jgi:hypothetical protein
MGVTAEIILRADSFYSLDEKIGMRLGFWLPPICFFLLILYRRLVPLSRDIQRAEKIIITDQVINKEEIYKAQYKTYTYNIKGRIETYEVSKEFYDSLNSGDEIEVHKTAVRKKILYIIAPSSKKMFKNTAIFK